MPPMYRQKTTSEGAGNWSRYSNPDSMGMSTFGAVKATGKDERLPANKEDRSQEKGVVADPLDLTLSKNSRQGTMTVNMPAKAKKRSRYVHNARNAHNARRALRRWRSQRVSVPDDREKSKQEPTSSEDRSLEDLFRENPSKSLQISLDAGILNIARDVVIQVINEATQEWLYNWYPDAKLLEILDSILVPSHKGVILDEHAVVPSEAFELGQMKMTMADIYRKCHKVHPTGAGDISIPTLLNLIDYAVIFLAVLKDSKRRASLEELKSSIQGIPVRLGGKRLLVMKSAAAKLKEFNAIFRNGISHDHANQGISIQTRAKKELEVLEYANVQFETHITAFNNTMVQQLAKVLAETRPPSN